MKSSPKLRPNVWDALVVLAVLALAAGGALAVWSGGGGDGTLTAVVTIDGEEADRFSPADLLEGPRTYTNNGYTLEVACGLRGAEDPPPDHAPPAGKSGLFVAASDCPTQDCVRTGLITRSGQSIVCLPARIIVRLEGGTVEDGGVDAVVG